MSYSRYSDINSSYLESSQKSMNPIFPNFWRNNPLSEDTLIDPRRAGYHPYFQYQVVSKQDKWIDSGCPVFQYPCSLIQPVNKCFLRTHEIIQQP